MRRRLVCGVVLSLLLSAPAAAVEPTPKHVLILHPFGPNASPFSAVASTFQITLARDLGEPVDIYEEPMDADRFPDPQKQVALVEFLQKRFAGVRLDLLVPIGSLAARFVVEHGKSAFPGTPVVFVATDPRLVPPELLKMDATSIRQESDLAGMVEDILQMAPDTTNIAVVFGATPLEQFWTAQCRREFHIFENRVKFTWLNGLSLYQMQERVATLPPHSFILFLMLIRDAAGVTYDGYQPLQRLHAVANAPLFGFYQSQMGLGIVGGRLNQDESLGIEAARAGIRILHGEPAANIPPLVLPTTPPVYDWRELKRWGISEARLPAGSVIRFRQPTTWELHRWRIVGIVSLCLFELLLIVGLLTNLVRRRRVEKSLRESKAQLSLAAASTGTGLGTLDLNTGQIWATDKAGDLFGFPPGEEINVERLERVVHPEDRGTILRAVQQAIQSGGDVEVDYRVFHSDGGIRWMASRVRPQKNPAGKVTHLTVVAIDISERKRAEEEIVGLRLQTWHSDRVARTGAITASLAHELTQPLAAILSNAEAASRFLAGGNPNFGELREILEDIILDDKRAAAVINSLRAMLKRQVAKHERINLADTLRDIMHLLNSELQKQHVEVVLHFDSDYDVLAFKAQIQQVLLNLVMNAVEAMQCRPSNGRRLEVTLALQSPDEALIVVRDTGPGIPEENRNRLFEAFWTTKEQGMGIGLSICRSIIQSHGGKIWFTNNQDRGVSFCFTLPLAPAACLEKRISGLPLAADRLPAFQSGAEELPLRARVLVVDDSEASRRATSSILADTPSMEFVEAVDGAEAIRKAKDLKPDLILLDIGLPGMNGIEAAAEIQVAAPDSKIVFLSQYDTPEFVRAVLHTGARGYVLKVDAGKELLPALTAVLRGDRYLSAGIRDCDLNGVKV